LPLQVFAEAVTAIVATTGAFVPFAAVNEEMLPAPLAARPIEVVLFVQVYVAPDTALLKDNAGVLAALHTTRLDGKVTAGVGLNVIVKFCGRPTQLLAEGVTETVATTGLLVALIAVKEDILPAPLRPRPMDDVVLFQVKEVPDTGPPNVKAGTTALLQTVCADGKITVGVGLAVIVKVPVVPVHPFASGVIVTVATTGEVVTFVTVKGNMLPAPVAARPIDVALFDHVNVEPATGPAIAMREVLPPLQTAWLLIRFTVGVGFTVTLKF
jgi:hypothetical protein